MQESTDSIVLIHDKTLVNRSGTLDLSTDPPTVLCPAWCSEDSGGADDDTRVHKHVITVPAGGRVAVDNDATEVSVTVEQYVAFGGSPLAPDIRVHETTFDLSVFQDLTSAGVLAAVAAMTQALAVVLTAGHAGSGDALEQEDRTTYDDLGALVDERIARMVSQLRVIAVDGGGASEAVPA